MTERAQAHPVDRLVPADQRRQRTSGSIGLAVDVEAHVRKPFEQLAHQRDRGPAVDAHLGEFVGGHVGDRAVDAAGA